MLLPDNISKNDLQDYAQQACWYHTIELTNDIKTDGVFDHRPYLSHYGFPKSLEGMSVLDVGCSDGFFSFEFKRRGAAEVVAVDTNFCDGSVAISPSPSKEYVYQQKYREINKKNQKFLPLAKSLGLDRVRHISVVNNLLGANVNYQDKSIYELTSLGRQFDFVFCGDLIEHLKNPIEAVEQLRQSCRRQCIISLSNALLLPIVVRWIERIPLLRDKLVTYNGSSGGTFFHFHPMAFRALLLASGFSAVTIHSNFYLPSKKSNFKSPHAIFHCTV